MNQLGKPLPAGYSSFPETAVCSRGEDPVTFALMENIMGNLPKSKEKVVLECSICKIDFTSEIPYQMHLNGSKHAKKIRSLEVMQLLQDEAGISVGATTPNAVRCEICCLSLNSSQQMHLHLTGAKHRGKAARAKAREDSASVGIKKEKAIPSESTDTGDDSDQPAAKRATYYCETCNVTLNSKIQFDQHNSSPKHQNKLTGTPPPKKPSWKNRGKDKMSPQGLFNVPPLNEAFVSGEPL